MYQESAFKPDWNTSQHYQNSNDRYCCHFINFPVTGGLRRTPDQQQFYAKMASLADGGTPEGRSAKMNDLASLKTGYWTRSYRIQTWQSWSTLRRRKLFHQ